MKRRLLAFAGIPILVAGGLIWHQIDTGLHNAAGGVAQILNAITAGEPALASSPVIESVTPPLRGSTAGPQLSEVPTSQLDYDGQRRRLNEFFLERYYSDLQKEAGFGSDDVNTLVQLWRADESELEKALGAEKYQRWKEYEAKVDSKAAVSRLGRNLSGSDQLRDDQADMLYRAIFEEQRRRDEELRVRRFAAPSDPRLILEYEFAILEIKEESNRRLISLAKSFLSEKQFAALPEAIVDPNVADHREHLEEVRAKIEHRSPQ
jgi:hypothetical protein